MPSSPLKIHQMFANRDWETFWYFYSDFGNLACIWADAWNSWRTLSSSSSFKKPMAWYRWFTMLSDMSAGPQICWFQLENGGTCEFSYGPSCSEFAWDYRFQPWFGRDWSRWHLTRGVYDLWKYVLFREACTILQHLHFLNLTDIWYFWIV